jgi:hypothetical protein
MNLKVSKVLMLVAVLCLGTVSNLFGAAATIAYVWPVAGVTAPTAAQAARHNSVVADVTWTNASDTAVVMTHNMQLPNATGLNGIPKITWFCTSMGAGTFVPFFAFTSATTITVDKNSVAANTTGVCRVTIERPAGAVR